MWGIVAVTVAGLFVSFAFISVLVSVKFDEVRTAVVFVKHALKVVIFVL